MFMSWLLAFGDGRPTDNFYSNREGALGWVSEKTWMGVRDNGHPPPSVPPKNLLDVKMKDLPDPIHHAAS